MPKQQLLSSFLPDLLGLFAHLWVAAKFCGSVRGITSTLPLVSAH